MGRATERPSLRDYYSQRGARDTEGVLLGREVYLQREDHQSVFCAFITDACLPCFSYHLSYFSTFLIWHYEHLGKGSNIYRAI